MIIYNLPKEEGLPYLLYDNKATYSTYADYVSNISNINHINTLYLWGRTDNIDGGACSISNFSRKYSCLIAYISCRPCCSSTGFTFSRTLPYQLSYLSFCSSCNFYTDYAGHTCVVAHISPFDSIMINKNNVPFNLLVCFCVITTSYMLSPANVSFGNNSKFSVNFICDGINRRICYGATLYTANSLQFHNCVGYHNSTLFPFEMCVISGNVKILKQFN